MHPLLTPRFKVIADYPGSRQRVGDIYTQCPNGAWRSKETDSVSTMADVMQMHIYPHLFQRLEWYEERTPEEMPEYVIHGKTKDIGKVAKWHCNERDMPIPIVRSFAWLIYQPATLEEYTAYQQSLK